MINSASEVIVLRSLPIAVAAFGSATVINSWIFLKTTSFSSLVVCALIFIFAIIVVYRCDCRKTHAYFGLFFGVSLWPIVSYLMIADPKSRVVLISYIPVIFLLLAFGIPWITFLFPKDVGYPRCTVCQYDLTKNTSGICPECGNEIAMHEKRF